MKEDWVFAAGFFVGGLLALFIACGIAEIREINFKAEAVKAGVAQWVPDERGNTKFEWIKKAEK